MTKTGFFNHFPVVCHYFLPSMMYTKILWPKYIDIGLSFIKIAWWNINVERLFRYHQNTLDYELGKSDKNRLFQPFSRRRPLFSAFDYVYKNISAKIYRHGAIFYQKSVIKYQFWRAVQISSKCVRLRIIYIRAVHCSSTDLFYELVKNDKILLFHGSIVVYHLFAPLDMYSNITAP